MRKGTQLELPLPKATTTDRQSWIRDRLAGYEMRQMAREARRSEAARRRKLRKTQVSSADHPPVQFEITRAVSL